MRYADNFVIAHPDLKELQQSVKRVKRWLERIGLHLHETHLAHTLTPHQGQIGFDFLGFNIHQELEEKIPKSQSGQKNSPLSKTRVKTIVNPSEDANKRHLATIDQRLEQLQTASQAQVIAELNPLIVGWVTYYNGVVEASVMGRYDDLVEQRLIRWASKRHPGKARDWLLSRYWPGMPSESTEGSLPLTMGSSCAHIGKREFWEDQEGEEWQRHRMWRRFRFPHSMR